MAKPENKIVLIATEDGDITTVLNSLQVVQKDKKVEEIEVVLPPSHEDQELLVTVSDNEQKLQSLGWQWINNDNPYVVFKRKGGAKAEFGFLTIIRAGNPASVDYYPPIQIPL